jgi:hypothetical protein
MHEEFDFQQHENKDRDPDFVTLPALFQSQKLTKRNVLTFAEQEEVKNKAVGTQTRING